MKPLILLFMLALCTSAYAQIQEQEPEGLGTDMPMTLDAEPMNETPADEVRGITYEKEGKMCFVMGDDTKKGLYNHIAFSFDNKSYIVKKGNLYGIANNKAEITVEITYDSIFTDYTCGAGFVVKQHGKYGKITSNGAIMLAIKYQKIIAGNQHITLVENSKNKTELIFNNQNKALNKDIDYAELYQNLTIVKSDGKFGVVKNKIIVPFEYDSIFIPSQNPMNIPIGSRNNNTPKRNIPNPLLSLYRAVSCLTIQKNNKVGLVNSDGEIIYPVNNDEVYNAESYGYYSVKKDNLYGIYFILSKEKKYTEIAFNRISVDGYGAIMASKNDKMGIFKLTGEQITPFEYDNDFIMQYTGIGYRISKNKKRGVIDHQGKVVVPPIYDDVSTISMSERDAFKVKKNEKYGIVNRKGKVIVPVEFEYIDDIKDNYLVIAQHHKMGLYDKNGNSVVPTKYKRITETTTPGSNVLVLTEENGYFNFLDKNNKFIFSENVIEYGYVLDENKLKNPIGLMGLLYVKSKSGKVGLLNEELGTLSVPMVYDEIMQYISAGENQLYFSVRAGKQYGLINAKNEVLIPLKYDTINLSFATSTANLNENTETENNHNNIQLVVATGKKYGTVNLKNEVVIPFQYSFLQRISHTGLFKAKTGKQYQIIDKDGKPICKNTFDEVANFEQIDNKHSEDYTLQALTFYNGKMRVINSKGNFITDENPMQPHKGYETFDELKFALIKALESKEDTLLAEFVNKIAPSEHLLYYLKQSVFDKSTLYVDINHIKQKYLSDLITFKRQEWNADTRFGYMGYNRTSLHVVDYTRYSERYGVVTNLRTSDHAYGDSRFMEKLLRNAIKINGYWISTYFMTPRFNRN